MSSNGCGVNGVSLVSVLFDTPIQYMFLIKSISLILYINIYASIHTYIGQVDIALALLQYIHRSSRHATCITAIHT